MAAVNAYLTFNGNCEDAFSFYKSIFGGEFTFMGKFKDMPPSDENPVTPEDADKIMHVSLPISAETVLMGSDAGGGWCNQYKEGNNITLSISVSSKEEADKLFGGLSEGGSVTMPMDNTFWGAYFGMFADKYGINWMVNFEQSQPK